MSNKKTIIRVIALISAALIMACMLLMFTGCAPAEADEVETTTAGDEKSEYVIIRLPDDTIVRGYLEGYVYRYSNGCVEVTIDGVEYFIHSVNVVVMESEGYVK